MISLATLSVFLLAVLALFLSPGPNMAFVLSHGVAHGMRGGFAAALGIGAADLILTVLAATGITVIVAAWPPAFDILRYAGALYLLRLALQAIRSPGKAAVSARAEIAMTTIFRMAMFNSLLNPKALLFFLVFLPQFVDPAHAVLPQIVLLGMILSTASVAFNSLLAAFSGQVGRYLARSPLAAKRQGWFLAAVLAALAARLLLLDRPLSR
jgi:threonine/homoserine/homoserine lactone efflux protein